MGNKSANRSKRTLRYIDLLRGGGSIVTVKRENLKLCFAASAGGHLTQLLKVVPGFKDYNIICVTTSKLVAKKLNTYGRTYIVSECNRQHPFRSFQSLFQAIKIIFKERPDVVISTGAEPAFLICITAKLFGGSIVWIDSVANVQRLSLSGKIIKPFADLFLTQWPDLADASQKIEYAGALL